MKTSIAISTHGRIFRKSGEEVIPFVRKETRENLNRLVVRLPFEYFTGLFIRHTTCTIPVHRIVLMSSTDFVFKEGYVIHHKNGDHFDNRLCNLEYLTASEHNKKTASTQHLWSHKISEAVKKTKGSLEWKEKNKSLFEKHSKRMKESWNAEREKWLNALQNEEVKEKRKKSLEIWRVKENES